MSSLRSGWILSLQVLVAGVVLLSSQVHGQVQGVHWRNNLDAAKIEAAQSGRLVLLHFWSNSCGPCKTLEKSVFSLSQVGAAIESQYVPVKVDVTFSPALAGQFRIEKVPTDVILSPQGSHVSTLPSPLTAPAYLAGLANIARDYSRKSSNQFAMQTGLVPTAKLNSAYAHLAATQTAQQAGAVTQSPIQQVGSAQYQATRNAAMPQAHPNAGVLGGSGPNRSVMAGTNANMSRAINPNPTVPANAMPRSYRNQYVAVQQPPAGTVDRYQNRTMPPATSSQVMTAKSQTIQMSAPRIAATQTPIPQSPPHQAPNAEALASRSPPQVASAPGGISSPQTSLAAAASNSPQLPSGSPPLGFDGYCPVSLKFDKSRWIPGNVQFGVIHRGRTYLCAGEQQRQQFLANPDAFSPVFSGMDPVLLLDTNQSVQGKRKYGYEYRGAFYLFSCEETMLKFKNKHDHYAASVRQAMNRLDGQTATIRR
jgi:YHS domain-containing protein/thiol-disulfide isomerase/thioredoxin